MNDPGGRNPEFESGFLLGPWRVEPRRNVLIQGEEERRLENRLMQTLVFLAEHQGQAVTREQFFDAVWKGLVVNEEALSRAISLLRSALDDDSRSPKFIQTIPGVGYRLIAEAVPVEEQKTEIPTAGAGETASRAVRRPSRIPRWAPLGVLALVLGYVVLDIFWLHPKGVEPEVSTTGGQAPSATAPQKRDENSVMVMPFVNMSSDPEQEYFADGVTEEILNLLAGVSNLRVPARTSSFFFKGRNEPVAQIAKTLGVSHVLEGSVRKSGGRVRITAQLIEADTDKHLWSKTYDRELKDVLKIQEEVASSIAGSLVDSFKGLESAPASRTDSLAAYEAYRTGRLLWWRRSPRDFRDAIELFNRAITSDPGYAPAYAAVADSWLLLEVYGKVHIMDAVEKARPMIAKALELDPESCEAFAARGLSRLIVGDKDEAELDLRHAIALNGNYIPAYAWLSALLRDLGRVPEEGEVLQKALDKDPLNTVLVRYYAAHLQTTGDSASAKKLVVDQLRLQPDSPTLLMTLSSMQLGSGELAEAWASAKRAYDRAPANTLVVIAMAKAWEGIGAAREAEKVLQAGLANAPRNVDIKLEYLHLLMAEGRTEDAERLKAGLFPKDVSYLPAAIQRTYHYETGLLELVKGEDKTARDHLAQALNPDQTQLYDNDQITTLTLVALLADRLGNAVQAERYLQMAERTIGHARVDGVEDADFYYSVACVFALRGERQRALQALQTAYDKGWRQLWLLDNDDRLESIRKAPVFLAVRKRVVGDLTAAGDEVHALRAAGEQGATAAPRTRSGL